MQPRALSSALVSQGSVRGVPLSLRVPCRSGGEARTPTRLCACTKVQYVCVYVHTALRTWYVRVVIYIWATRSIKFPLLGHAALLSLALGAERKHGGEAHPGRLRRPRRSHSPSPTTIPSIVFVADGLSLHCLILGFQDFFFASTRGLGPDDILARREELARRQFRSPSCCAAHRATNVQVSARWVHTAVFTGAADDAYSTYVAQGRAWTPTVEWKDWLTPSPGPNPVTRSLRGVCLFPAVGCGGVVYLQLDLAKSPAVRQRARAAMHTDVCR